MIGWAGVSGPKRLPKATSCAVSRRWARKKRTRKDSSAARMATIVSSLGRARRSMPDGVPMAWIAGLHRHPPLYVRDGDGSRFEDLDGNRYLDFNLADLSNTVGYGDTPVARRLAELFPRAVRGSASRNAEGAGSTPGAGSSVWEPVDSGGLGSALAAALGSMRTLRSSR